MTRPDGAIQFPDLPSGRATLRVDPSPAAMPPGLGSFNPDARYLAGASASDGRVSVLDLERGRIVATLPIPAPPTGAMAWSPDGRTLAIGCQPPRAVALVGRALELAPRNATYLSKLGVALYRVGRLREAEAVLTRSREAGRDNSDAYDHFFLAMTRHRLGRPDMARSDFERAFDRIASPGNTPRRARRRAAPGSGRGHSRPGRAPRELPPDVFAR